MNAGTNFEYLWADNNMYKKPTKVTIAHQLMPEDVYLSVAGLPHHPPIPTQVSAKQYVDLLMSWVEEQLNDDNVFPTSTGKSVLYTSSIIMTIVVSHHNLFTLGVISEVPFPRNFKAMVSKIFTRLFRVYGHIYLTHVSDIERSGNVIP